MSYVDHAAPAYRMPPPVERARVVVAPASAADSMLVVRLGHSSAQPDLIPAGNWAPRGAALLPSVGNQCAVIRDTTGDYWVSVWNPG
jgi:hypothetical protein